MRPALTAMQVFDLTRLRHVDHPPMHFTPDTVYHNIFSAHNIVIDTATGFAYTVGNSMGGETCGGALHMIDIRDPRRPTFAGCYADPSTGRARTGYTHDAQCVVVPRPGPEVPGAGDLLQCFGDGAGNRRRDRQGESPVDRAGKPPQGGVRSPGLAVRGPALLLPRRRGGRTRRPGAEDPDDRLRRGRPRGPGGGHRIPGRDVGLGSQPLRPGPLSCSSPTT